MNPTLQGVKQRFGIIGNSQSLNHAIQIAMRVAPTDLSVLINGESGVGKEAFSKILHQLSPRKHEKFIAVNCGAIPEGTIDSELFGHEKGAFTGAQDKRKGYFETVNGGTIFLDEIGEMPVGTQARLLRVLESGEFIKVGSSEVQKTNVRIVAATNRNLLRAAEQGKFREDLYYRLSTVPITIPALRDRGDDILLLFRKFATDFAERHRRRPLQLSEDAQSLLQRYPWPGNVRQLRNMADQLSVLAIEDIVGAQDIIQLIPDINANRLPAVRSEQADHTRTSSAQEDTTLLVKMFIELKQDINALKKIIGHTDPAAFREDVPLDNHSFVPSKEIQWEAPKDDAKSLVVHSKEDIPNAEEIEDSLSLMDMEKQMIKKALDKHQGRRKNAAEELGISERTLYRKIREYDI